MKTTQRGGIFIAAVFFMLFAVGIAIKAQTDSQTTTDDILQPLAPSDVMTNHGPFFLMSDYLNNGGNLGGPYPFLKNTNAAVYSLNGSSFLVDDASITNDDDLANALLLLAQPQDQSSANLMGRSLAMDVPNPGDPGDTNSPGNFTNNNVLYSLSSFSTNGLWIEVASNSLAVSNQFAVILHNTDTDAPYAIFASTNLALPLTDWTLEQSVIGSEDTNFTDIQLTLNGRSSLFVTARFDGSSDGSGLPDWWEQKYFGTNGVDPYGDPDGDGWNNLQEFQKQTNPLMGNTPPPPPIGLSVQWDATGMNAVVTWQSGGGLVDHYEIDMSYSGGSAFEVGEVNSSTFSYVKPINYNADQDGYASPHLSVVAIAADGSRAPTEDLPPGAYPSLNRECWIVESADGKYHLAINNFPQNIARVHLFWPSDFSSISPVDLYPSNMVNGVFALSDEISQNLKEAAMVVRLIDNIGRQSENCPVSPLYFQEENTSEFLMQTNYVDLSVQMRQNLKFLLRAAGVLSPFGYSSGLYYSGTGIAGAPGVSGDSYYSERQIARGVSPTNYEYYGYNTFSPHLNYSFVDSLRPERENFLWQNFLYNPDDYTNLTALFPGGKYANSDTGIDWDFGLNDESGDIFWPMLDGPKYQYSGSGTETPLPLAFDSSNSGWIFHAAGPGPNMGFSDSDTTLSSSVTNVFGLHLESAYFDTNFVPVGAPIPISSDGIFEDYAEPGLKIVGYFFNSQTPFFNYTYSSSYAGPAPALPGSPTFSTTNTSPLLIAGIGQPILVSAWAKMAITNGYAGKFAYLQQYFDGAYTLDENGDVTNTAGFISSEGKFFPTASGPATLITKFDADTGERGTGIVNVIKLQLDANHDGKMDLSFGGPDNTSVNHPFQFWVNDDTDEGGFPLSPGKEKYEPDSPDYLYSNPQHGFGIPCMRSQRDLEDYARLWICGMPALTNSDYQITLSWANVSKGNPAVELFQSVETNGGVLYLTDTNVAATQLVIPGPGRGIARVANGEIFVFPENYFSNSSPKYLLFEGTATGSGQLLLTVMQGTNVIAQTSAWIELDEVRDMFEHVHIEGAPSTNDVPPTVALADQSTYKEDNIVPVDANDGNQLVVFVHGWRLTQWVAENFAQTMFKRLWLQGYQGRYAALHYPTLSSASDGTPGEFFTFNRDEYIAFKCGKGAANYFLRLQSRFPDYAINACSHSHGAIVMMEALKTHLANGQTPVHNYALMQAAVAAECFDTNAPIFSGFVGVTPPTLDFFYGYPGYIRDAISGKMANFYNTNDFGVVLTWQPNQIFFKPDGGFFYYYDPISGLPTRGLTSPRIVSDPHELMAFLSRPRTQAVGGVADLGGAFTPTLQVDLTSLVGFGDDWADHSGEFNSNIQRTYPLYHTLGQRLEVIP